MASSQTVLNLTKFLYKNTNIYLKQRQLFCLAKCVFFRKLILYHDLYTESRLSVVEIFHVLYSVFVLSTFQQTT